MSTPLGNFVRAGRNRLQPTEVGLVSLGRRRTPGLRREEVATLAGISVHYLTGLEQGRYRNPSSSVLAALASALRLDSEDRTRFWSLAAATAGREFGPLARSIAELPDGAREVIDRLHPTAACVVGPSTDVLAANVAWRATVAPLGLRGDTPNLTRYLFTDPRARAVLPDWPCVADAVVRAVHRVNMHRSEPSIGRLVDDLHDNQEFMSRWTDPAIGRPLPTRPWLHLDHPVVGDARITAQQLLIPGPVSSRMIVWLPADLASADALREAGLGTSRRLRLVGRGRP